MFMVPEVGDTAFRPVYNFKKLTKSIRNTKLNIISIYQISASPNVWMSGATDTRSLAKRVLTSLSLGDLLVTTPQLGTVQFKNITVTWSFALEISRDLF